MSEAGAAIFDGATADDAKDLGAAEAIPTAPTPIAELLMKARLELWFVDFMIVPPEHSLSLAKKAPFNWPPWLWQTS
jgi:hypothetical protein